MFFEWRESNNQKYLYVEAQDNYTLGLALGEALGDKIDGMKKELDQLTKSMGVDKEEYKTLTDAYVKLLPEEYRLEIKGMYDGYNAHNKQKISWDDILNQAVFINVIYQFMCKLPNAPSFEACTNFGVVNNDGTVVHGQNYDAGPELGAVSTFVHHKLPNQPEVFLCRMGADLGTACGKNSEGVCLTVSVVQTNLAAPIMMPRGVLVREAMKQTDARHASEKITDEGKTPFCYNLVLSDHTQVIATQSIPLETRVTWVKKSVVQSNQYDYFDWIQYLRKPCYSKKRQIYAENLVENIFTHYGKVTNGDLLEILRDAPVICRETKGDGIGSTIFFLTRECFGMENATKHVGRLPF